MNEKIQKVKTKLLKLGFIDNEWLDKYLEILSDNLNTPMVRRSTQAHHAIPVNSYWASDEPYDRRAAQKLAAADVDNFKVNLLYKDHLRIHSYLTLCTDLDKVQQRYEAQANLRKQNSLIGVIATNKKLNNKSTDKYKTSKITFIQQYYSAEETEEILDL